MAHACGICGARDAAHGFRLPGLRSQLPKEKRGYLWACDDHRAEAEQRWRAATTIKRDQPPPQGDLFP